MKNGSNGSKSRLVRLSKEDTVLVEAEARRIGARPSKVLRYWLRVGARQEPQINSILT